MICLTESSSSWKSIYHVVKLQNIGKVTQNRIWFQSLLRSVLSDGFILYSPVSEYRNLTSAKLECIPAYPLLMAKLQCQWRHWHWQLFSKLINIGNRSSLAVRFLRPDIEKGLRPVQKHWLELLFEVMENYDAVGIWNNLLTKGNCIAVPSESGDPSPAAQTAGYEGWNSKANV